MRRAEVGKRQWAMGRSWGCRQKDSPKRLQMLGSLAAHCLHQHSLCTPAVSKPTSLSQTCPDFPAWPTSASPIMAQSLCFLSSWPLPKFSPILLSPSKFWPLSRPHSILFRSLKSPQPTLMSPFSELWTRSLPWASRLMNLISPSVSSSIANMSDFTKAYIRLQALGGKDFVLVCSLLYSSVQKSAQHQAGIQELVAEWMNLWTTAGTAGSIPLASTALLMMLVGCQISPADLQNVFRVKGPELLYSSGLLAQSCAHRWFIHW